MRHRQILSNLQELQVAQREHDLAAHQDILLLPIPRRLTHFTLHFAKYQGAIHRALRTGEEATAKRVLIDSLAIALAAANALNVDLAQRIGHGLQKLGPALDSEKSALSVLGYYCEIVGEMAKACEALDHLEAFPSRETLESSIVALIVVIERLADLCLVDLTSGLTARWKSAEAKSLFNSEGVTQPRPLAAVA